MSKIADAVIIALFSVSVFWRYGLTDSTETAKENLLLGLMLVAIYIRVCQMDWRPKP